MRQPSVFDVGLYAGAIAVGLALIVVARIASRRRGSRLDSFVALRVGDVLLTEVIGAFLIGYGLGSLVSIQSESRAAPGPPPPTGGRFVGVRGFGAGDRLPFMLAIAFALIAVLIRIDIRDVLLGGRSTRNPLSAYVGWDARVVAPIIAGGHGEITMRDGAGNIMSVAATADVDIPVGTDVRVVGARDLNLVVAPLASAR
ncbi:MAG TPA: NfeD family protein [Candidatus Limnocylindria bacterium]|nr:NfeD family protein [Candidatus Limnocylindria bacterium]